MKKLLALVLALLMLSVSALAELPDYINTDSELPIVKAGEVVELDIVETQLPGWGNAGDLWWWKFVEDQMNIKVNVVQAQDISLYKSLAFSSNELPDIFISGNFSSSQLVQYGALEGQILDLMPYVNEEYMPNFYKMTQDMPDLLSRVSTSDGKLYSLPFIEGTELRGIACHAGGSRYFVNTKLLDEIGAEIPVDLDDFINVLRDMKAYDENIVPLGGSAASTNPGALILIAMGYLTSDSWGLTPCLRNGEVVIPAGDRELFGEYLSIMHDLWSEGLIEEDFFTLDGNAVNARMAQNEYGVFGQVAYLTLPNSFQDWWHVEPLTSEWNATQQWPTKSINLDSTATTISTGNFVITTACPEEKLAAALRFADWFYNENSTNFGLSWWGPSAEFISANDISYGITQGWVMDPETRAFVYLDTNDGTKDYQFRCEHVIGIHSGQGWGNGLYTSVVPQIMAGLETDPSKLTTALDPNNGDDHYRISEIAMVRDHLVTMFPDITFFDADEVIAIGDYSVLIGGYVKEETAKFVTGLRPLSELDSYFDALDAMGFNDWLQIYVDYYDGLTK